MPSTHKGLGLTPHYHRYSHTLTQGITTPEHPVNNSSVYTSVRVETKTASERHDIEAILLFLEGGTVFFFFFFAIFIL